MTVSNIAAHLDEFGYVIIKDLIHPLTVDALKRQIDCHLEITVPDSANPFMGAHTKRFGRCLERLPISREIVRHQTVIDAVKSQLCRISPTIQIHFTGVMHLMEGERSQLLHRDASPFSNPGPPVVVAAMWAVSDFTHENGATVLVPGSHRWPTNRKPKVEELRIAEMTAGSVLIYLGNLIHGAGACIKGQRTGLNLQYSVGWLRQEENQYLAVDQRIARTFDDDLLSLMGYDLAQSHWGYVDQCHPLRFIRGDEAPGWLDGPDYRVDGRVHQINATLGELHGNPYYPSE